MTTLRIALAQINTTVGDLAGNAAKVRDSLDRSRAAHARIVLFPELTLTGYPPEDLLLKPGFAGASRAALSDLLGHTRGLTAIVGFAERDHDLFNAAAVLHDGQLAGVYRKSLLPNYAVFDEERYFAHGRTPGLFSLEAATDDRLSKVRFGLSICEDIWYPSGPPQAQATAGAELLLNIAASPFESGKARNRERMLATRAADNVAIVAFCNLVGAQDELVFDGGSLIVDARGELLARASSFEEELLVCDVEVSNVFRQRLRDPRRRKAALFDEGASWIPLHAEPPLQPPPPLDPRPLALLLDGEEEIYRALVLGTRDYVKKNGFESVVIGLSGGVDSALVAAIAVDALGAEHVVGVSMPSRFSSEHSRSDAAEVARRLGIRLEVVDIEPAHQAYLKMLQPLFAGADSDATEENLQSRARGNVLMALSNKFGWLVLTTGNKSELAVGYTTIYGDMAGGFAVIKDVPKSWVWRLCRYRNDKIGAAIPDCVLVKAPSAELAPDQKDTDTLPEYDVLDAILAAYVEEDCSEEEIVARGHALPIVRRVIRMVDQNEYKRRQAPPGPKVTSKAFGKDRRLPITSRYGSRGTPLPSGTAVPTSSTRASTPRPRR